MSRDKDIQDIAAAIRVVALRAECVDCGEHWESYTQDTPQRRAYFAEALMQKGWTCIQRLLCPKCEELDYVNQNAERAKGTP